jgi:hypothetical protein
MLADRTHLRWSTYVLGQVICQAIYKREYGAGLGVFQDPQAATGPPLCAQDKTGVVNYDFSSLR